MEKNTNKDKVNRMLIGVLAIEYRKENYLDIILANTKELLEPIIEMYSDCPEIPLKLDITDIPKTARLLLLKFSEERQNLVCISKNDIQDPILFSRFMVSKESMIQVKKASSMPLMDFAKIYNTAKNDETANIDLNKMIMENCPMFITLPKNKVMEILMGD